ncbi:hypothetical protein CAC42_3062 [Sphaceloma murrayae]|uniref:R3H domain-containing protein n=1 Tax=Sphaceloma murrayae TaxID=2082308 RepID=A0A2K1QRF0_9PEZI|nr:hypothetical protein CAC42_3062 [Sphaceloma murrayae]
MLATSAAVPANARRWSVRPPRRELDLLDPRHLRQPTSSKPSISARVSVDDLSSAATTPVKNSAIVVPAAPAPKPSLMKFVATADVPLSNLPYPAVPDLHPADSSANDPNPAATPKSNTPATSPPKPARNAPSSCLDDACECEDSGPTPCTQACGKPKRTCSHPDEAPCHAPYPCKEDKPCNSKIVITCPCQAQKQEVRCNATKDAEGNSTRSLACTDECARLERNRRLAVALNIDQEAHVEGGENHVPYSDETLDLYSSFPSWAMAQEREFRVFADEASDKRLRFKPMRAQERAFLHALAQDFGLDSESLDPEPHRHVVLLKTPRFVRAPGKTVGEAVRVRQLKRKVVERPKEVRKMAMEEEREFNALVLVGCKFGLTLEEVRSLVLAAVPEMRFETEFLLSEEVVLRPAGPGTVEEALKDVKPALEAACKANAIGTLQLCAVDDSLNILRRENDPSAADGWSRVAAKGAAPRKAPTTAAVSGPNAYAALSGVGVGTGKVTFAKKKDKAKKVPVEPVVDDWEAEMEAEERRSQSQSAAVSDAEGGKSDVEGVRLDVQGVGSDVQGEGSDGHGMGSAVEARSKVDGTRSDVNVERELEQTAQEGLEAAHSETGEGGISTSAT